MNANDHVPMEHILPFGLCKKGMPCMPVTPLAWVDVNKKHIIEGAPALTEDSKLACAMGGVITIVPLNAGSAEEGDRNDDAEDVVEEIAMEALGLLGSIVAKRIPFVKNLVKMSGKKKSAKGGGNKGKGSGSNGGENKGAESKKVGASNSVTSRSIKSTSEMDTSGAGKLKFNGEIDAGRSGTTGPLTSTLNSYFKTKAGNIIVYDDKGKLLYDINSERVKIFDINKNPQGKEFFNPRKLTGSVPQDILDLLK